MPVSRPSAVEPQAPPVDDAVERAAVILHEAASVAINAVGCERAEGVKDIPVRPFDQLSDSIKRRYRIAVRRLMELGYWNAK